MRIGIDVGGTNTDSAVLDGTRVAVWAKTPTTADVLDGVAAVLRNVASQVDMGAVDAVNIGTTHFVNALVEVRGLAPVVAIRLATPPQTLEPMVNWPVALRDAVLGEVHVCAGGHQFTGVPMQPLDVEALRKIARSATARGLRQFAVSSVFSPVNAEGERLAADIIRAECPEASVTLSHEIGRLGILERENAAILNAALRPLAAHVVAGFASAMAEVGLSVPLNVSQNDGTVMGLELAREFPMLTFASGPTNSMRGAAFEVGAGDCVVVDVGGTTTDIGLLQGGFPRESALAVDVAGVRTNFRIPDVVSLAIGGGSIVRGDSDSDTVTVGPDSVGHQLTERALVFGGDTLTLTDVAVAAGVAVVGDPALVTDLDPSVVDATLRLVRTRIAEAIDKAKLQAGDVAVVAVGGGAFLVGDRMPGVAEVTRPAHAPVANAVGAAAANVSGEIDQLYSLMTQTRDEALADARAQAVAKAVHAGAAVDTVRIVDEEDIPLAYLEDSAAIRVRVRAVGDLPATESNNSKDSVDVAG
ncbi:hydantoinase/oxoprolinase N-terminal domain-containing protein [Rhodococcus sp. NPDC127530]|uniref:hydantoinase/oxoprolinase N-terminal domain-containing protein n=1 Tax=unclassified Rhodococcus (in: high G+C Gram-positive bacteria) TaxID=192944 RepID=UPI00363C33CE